jgi:hypothetical protein
MFRKNSFGWLIGLEGLAFSMLAGSIVGVALLMPPSLFKMTGSRDLAGRIFGKVLESWLWLAFPCTTLLIITGLLTLLNLRPFSKLLAVRLALPVIVGILIGVFAAILFRISDIQNSLTKPIDDYPTNVNPRLELDTLHSLSTNLISVALLLMLVWLVISVVALVKFRLNRLAETAPTVTATPSEKSLPLSV